MSTRYGQVWVNQLDTRFVVLFSSDFTSYFRFSHPFQGTLLELKFLSSSLCNHCDLDQRTRNGIWLTLPTPRHFWRKESRYDVLSIRYDTPAQPSRCALLGRLLPLESVTETTFSWLRALNWCASREYVPTFQYYITNSFAYICHIVVYFLHRHHRNQIQKYVVESKSFRSDQHFKVTEIEKLCYFSTKSSFISTHFSHLWTSNS